MIQLFNPLKIREITIKNRLAVSPMCQYSSEDGFANDWHMVHLGSRAAGGAGLVFTEATAVSPEGRISFADLGIWKDEHIDQLQKITRFIINQDVIPGIQLAHAGRKASYNQPWNGNKFLNKEQGGWEPVAPGNIPFSPESGIPHVLSSGEIEQLIGRFKAAAQRSLKAGFKIIEIHAAHGYLINEFLSPLSNNRTDNYGGNFGNRIRFLLEIVDEVRTVWPAEYPLFVRFSATEWTDGGWNINDSVALAEVLKKKNVDLIDCSSGGNIAGATIPVGPGYQVPLSEQIRKETGILTGAVGMITDSAQAEAILRNGQADLIIMAREFLRDPYFPLRAARELGADIKWPVQYKRARI